MQTDILGGDVADTLVALGKLLVALACGAAIGWERERHEKAAGLRTHMLVSAGACLFAIVGLRIQATSPQADLLRIVQGALMGTGFLAGGVIFREGASVRGLTTAAGLWLLAAIGLTVGLGDFLLAFAATALSFVTISLLGRVERKAKRVFGSG
ncbi:MAG: MgtC/SapB family protein [Candidatus Eiseniibacteriota bacterium]|nr:MAG: MgtC/SapB family protein [Candidatus Eisenbacteria bacterium]